VPAQLETGARHVLEALEEPSREILAEATVVEEVELHLAVIESIRLDPGDFSGSHDDEAPRQHPSVAPISRARHRPVRFGSIRSYTHMVLRDAMVLWRS